MCAALEQSNETIDVSEYVVSIYMDMGCAVCWHLFLAEVSVLSPKKQIAGFPSNTQCLAYVLYLCRLLLCLVATAIFKRGAVHSLLHRHSEALTYQHKNM